MSDFINRFYLGLLNKAFRQVLSCSVGDEILVSTRKIIEKYDATEKVIENCRQNNRKLGSYRFTLVFILPSQT